MTGENIEEAFLKCARCILTKIEQGKLTTICNNIFMVQFSIVSFKIFDVFTGEVDPERMGSGIQYGDASLRRLQRQQAQNRNSDCAC